MRPILRQSTALLAAGCIFVSTGANYAGEAKPSTNNHINTVTESVSLFELDYTVELPLFEEEVEAEKRPELDIPLSQDVQNYIWEASNKSNISYTMLIALAETESEFNIKAISKTHDYGLFQLQSNPTAKWIAKEMGLKQYDLLNPKTNTDMTIWYLGYLREYWRNKGMSEEMTFDMTILSYHYGIEGSKRYINNSSSNYYLKKVKEAKYKFEGLVIE